MIEGREFQIEDLMGVVACLRRNYPWMREKPEGYIASWIKPLCEHTWDETDKDRVPYSYGKVLIENGNIIGYLGAIGYKRWINKREISVLNLSTWAVDKGYRGVFIPYTEDMYYAADIILDLTPNPSSRMIECRLFDMNVFEERMIKLYLAPYVDNGKVKAEIVLDDSMIGNEVIRREYIDNHKAGGIKLLKVSFRMDTCFIFYKIIPDRSNRIRILKVSDPELWADNCHEISWELFKIESFSNNYKIEYADVVVEDSLKSCIECDQRFFGGKEINHPSYGDRKVTRLIKKNTDMHIEEVDNLYTEFALII